MGGLGTALRERFSIDETVEINVHVRRGRSSTDYLASLRDHLDSQHISYGASLNGFHIIANVAATKQQAQEIARLFYVNRIEQSPAPREPINSD